MFCPKCSQQQISDAVRFCSRCGLPLGAVADIVNHGDDELKRERRWVIGTVMLMVTAFDLFLYLFIFGVTTLPHLAHAFLWVWLVFVATSVAAGGVGLYNLLRGGFFRELKEREMRLRLVRLARESRLEVDRGGAAGAAALRPADGQMPVVPTTVTEATTRDLQAAPRFARKD